VEDQASLDNIDGEPISKVNFVLRDTRNRIWLTISTCIKNWMKAMSPNVSEGYIALVDEKGIKNGKRGIQINQ
jgi:gluconolactonase